MPFIEVLLCLEQNGTVLEQETRLSLRYIEQNSLHLYELVCSTWKMRTPVFPTGIQRL